MIRSSSMRCFCGRPAVEHDARFDMHPCAAHRNLSPVEYGQQRLAVALVQLPEDSPTRLAIQEFQKALKAVDQVVDAQRSGRMADVEAAKRLAIHHSRLGASHLPRPFRPGRVH